MASKMPELLSAQLHSTPTADDAPREPDVEARQNILERLKDAGGGPVPDVRVTELISTIEAVFAKEEKLQRFHSVQLVKLQSQIHELQQQRVSDVAARDDLLREVQDLYAKLADLKGRTASLTLDLECLGQIVEEQTLPALGNHDRRPVLDVKRSLAPRLPPYTILLEKLQDVDGDFEAVADDMLRAQKPKLLEALRKLYEVGSN